MAREAKRNASLRAAECAGREEGPPWPELPEVAGLGGRDDVHDDASLVVGEYSGEAVALPVSVDDWEPSPRLPP